MQGFDYTHALVVASLLFCTGIAGFMMRKNAIIVFMSIELMLNAVNLVLVTFSRLRGDLDGQVLAFFIMAVAAAEAAIGLGIIISLFRKVRSINLEKISQLRS